MDTWNEPISFASNGKPNDSLSKAEGKKDKLKKAPLQVNNDGSVTPLNQDGSPLDGSSYKRPEMSEESEGWKLNDKNAFNGKYDDVMDLDDVVSPSSLKLNNLKPAFLDEKVSWDYQSYVPGPVMSGDQLTVAWKNPPTQKIGVLGKLDVLKLEPNGGLTHIKTFQQGEILSLDIDQEFPTEYKSSDGFYTTGPSSAIYTIKTAHGFDKYSIPPYKLTYYQPVDEKSPSSEAKEDLTAESEASEKDSPQPWVSGLSSQQIIDQIKAAKESFEASQLAVDKDAYQALKAVNFAQHYGMSAKKQAELYKKYLSGKAAIPGTSSSSSFDFADDDDNDDDDNDDQYYLP